MLGFAAAASLSILLGLHLDHADRVAVRHYTADLHQVRAVVLGDDAGRRNAAGDSYTGQVRWTDAAGAVHQLRATVLGTAGSGSTVVVWLDAEGRPVTPPTSTAESAGRAVFLGFLAFLGSLTLVATTVSLGRAGLDRADLRDWQRNWQRVAPVWTGRP